MMFNLRCRLELGKEYCLQLLISILLFELLINLRKIKYPVLEHKKYVLKNCGRREIFYLIQIYVSAKYKPPSG